MAFKDLLVGLVELGKAIEGRGASDEELSFYVLQLKASRARNQGYNWDGVDGIMKQIIALLPTGRVVEKLREEFFPK